MLLLSIAFLLSCAVFKKPPEVHWIAIEELVVRQLESGNWEVKSGLIYGYAKMEKQIAILEARIRELEKK